MGALPLPHGFIGSGDGGQRRLEGQDLVARHVLRAVEPLDHEHAQGVWIVGCMGHGAKLRREAPGRVQRTSESIERRRFGFRTDATEKTAKVIGGRPHRRGFAWAKNACTAGP